jgi:hypothetical protein
MKENAIKLKDVKGRTVLSKTLKGGNSEEMISTTNLSPGMYSLLIFGDNVLIETIKITKLK